MKVNEWWYVRRPGATTLVLVQIIDITEQTIEVKGNEYQSFSNRPERYKKGCLEFVEKLEPGEEKTS